MQQNFPYSKNAKSHAKTLRREMTTSEKHLWYDFLKDFPAHIYKQRPFENYIADFYCPSAKLVIEVDGDSHYTDEALQYDKKRTAYFNSIGISVLRFTNYDIRDRFSGVCQMIEEQIKTSQSPTVTAPLTGEPMIERSGE